MEKETNKYDVFRKLTSGEKPLFVKGEGACLEDCEGKKYIDLNELSCCLGENNESLKKAILDCIENEPLTIKGENRVQARLEESS